MPGSCVPSNLYGCHRLNSLRTTVLLLSATQPLFATVFQSVSYAGCSYATLDNWPPGHTTNGCQTSFLALEAGWYVAPSDGNSQHVADSNCWATSVVVFSNGVGWRTSCYGTGQHGSGGLLAQDGNMYKPTDCSLRVLITDCVTTTTALTTTTATTITATTITATTITATTQTATTTSTTYSTITASATTSTTTTSTSTSASTSSSTTTSTTSSTSTSTTSSTTSTSTTSSTTTSTTTSTSTSTTSTTTTKSSTSTSSTTTTTTTTTTTVVEVIVNASVGGVDYGALSGNLTLQAAVQSAVAESIADVACQGVSSGNVAVDIQPGSVAVIARVTPPGNVPIDNIRAGLGSNFSTVTESMEARLQNVPGLQGALTGSLSVSLLGIMIARPVNDCSIYCHAPMLVPNGKEGALCAEGARINTLTSCSTQCATGFIPNLPRLLCVAGKLVPPSFECSPRSCDAAHAGPFGACPPCGEGSSIAHDMSCTVQCEAGYSASSDVLNCRFGILYPGTVLCQPAACAAPQLIPAALAQPCAEGMSVRHSGLCSGRCAPPLLAEPVVLACVNGNLTPPVFACVRARAMPCSAPAEVVNAAAPSCQGVNIDNGGTCLTRCVTGFLPEPSRLLCTNSILRPSTFRCKAPCSAPVGVADAASPSCHEGSRIQSGATCTSMCTGNRVSELHSLTCSDGVLSPSSFSCIVPTSTVCPNPVGVANAEVPPCLEQPVQGRGFCTARCRWGYIAEPLTMACSGTKLSPSAFICKGASCLMPSKITNAPASLCDGLNGGTEVESGRSCIALCNPGYVPYPFELQCRMGEFTPAAFTCLDWMESGLPVGPEPQDQVCVRNELCGIVDIQGVNLQEGDQLLLLSQCGSNGVALTHVGFPAGALSASSCGTAYVLGRLPLGEAEMCWCPKAIDCLNSPANFHKRVGRLHVGCADGYYFNGSDCALWSCQVPRNVIGGSSETCTEGTAIQSGGICTTRCTGTLVSSPQVLHCTNNVLRPATFVCNALVEELCAAPVGIDFVFNPSCQEGDWVASSRNCTSRCGSGYRPTTPFLACHRGVFTPATFKCEEAPCSLPSDHSDTRRLCAAVEGENSTVPLREIKSGNLCMTECLPGYVPFPSVMRCFRGELSPPTFSCIEWLDQEAVAESGFGPQGRLVARCGMEAECIISDLHGVGLQEQDKVMLLSRCGEGGVPLAEMSWWVDPIPTTDCGFSVSFGLVQMDTAKTGFAEACYCPKSIECGRDPQNFWKILGTLEMTCPITGNEPWGYFSNATLGGKCQLCTANSGIECGLCRNNMRKFNIDGVNVCSCTAGTYEAPGDHCELCGIGAYCPGEKFMAPRIPCIAGTSTVAGTAQSIIDCKCDRGYQVVINATTQETSCLVCQAGFYKSYVADEACSERCMPSASSKLGATERKDCYCVTGFYYHPNTGACNLCLGGGVECRGGFMNGTDRAHQPPVATPGHYMTAFDVGSACSVAIDGVSVCLGGSYDEADGSCEEGHTGIVCGACSAGWTRDQPKQSCSPCSKRPGLLWMVFSMNFELASIACLGLFLAQRAMSAALEQSKLDAVIMRIWMQWVAIGSVLGQLDFSKVELYKWGKDAAEMGAIASANEMAEEQESEFDFNFQFPEWFQNTMTKMTAFSELTQGAIALSTQESLECLATKYLGDGKMKHLIPVLYWIAYPFLLIGWLIFLALLLAKCLFPLYTIYFTKYMVIALTNAGGYTSEVASEKVKALGASEFEEFMSDPMGLLTNPGRLKQIFGEETVNEILAHQAYKRAPRGTFESEEQLLNLVSESHLNAKTLKELVLNPAAVKAQLLGSRPENAVQELEEAEEQSDRGERPNVDVHVEIPTTEEVEEEEEELHAATAFPVFGLFVGSSFRHVCSGIVPVILITVYTNWDFITKRFLMALQSEAFMVQVEPYVTEIQFRWTGDTRLIYTSGDHFTVAVVAACGLTLWSCGFLAFIAMIIKRNEKRLQEFKVLRKYGYFYNGLEKAYWWWDLLVKRIEVLLVYIVTYIQVTPDLKGTLTFVTALAAIFWALHATASPYDQRGSRLVDRLESAGLRTRFGTLFLVQILMLAGGNIIICLIAAIVLLVLNGIFVINVGVSFLIATGAFNDADGATDQAMDMQKNMPKTRKRGGGGNGNPLKMLLRKIVQHIINKVGKVLVGIAIKYLMAPFRWLAQAKQDLEKEAPRLKWVGLGQPLEVISHHAGFALRGTNTGYYLSANPDGELRVLKKWPRGPGKPPVMAFALSEQGNDTPLLVSTHGVHSYDSIEQKEVPSPRGEEIMPITVMVVTVHGEEYIVEDPPRVRCTCVPLHNGSILRAWASRHYLLDARSQRAYIAHTMGTFLDFLLVKANLGCIPSNLNDIVCLMTIAARRVANQGDQVELTNPASRRQVLEEVERVLEFNRNKIKEDAEQPQDEKAKFVSQKSTFSVLACKFQSTPDFTVSVEELTNMNCLLQHNDSAIVLSLLAKTVDIIDKAVAQLEEYKQERLQASQAPPSNVETISSDTITKQFAVFSCSPVELGTQLSSPRVRSVSS